MSEAIVVQEAAPALGRQQRADDLKTIARGTGINLVGEVAFTVLNVVFQVLLARGLGAASVGVFGLAISVLNLSVLLCLFGLGSGVVRFVALYMGQDDRLRAAGAIVAGLRVVLVISLVFTVLLIGLADVVAADIYHMPELGPVLRLAALSLPCTVLMRFVIGAAAGLKHMALGAAVGQILFPTVKVIGLLAAVYLLGYGVLGASGAIVLSSIAGGVVAAVWMWRLYPLRGVGERPVLMTGALVAFSWPLFLTSVVDLAGRETETLVLGALGTSEQVGLYYVSWRAAIMLQLILAAFGTIFAPVMAELYGRQEHGRLADLLKTVTKWGVTVCLPVFLVLFVLAEDVMRIFGEDFEGAAFVLRVLAISQLLNVAVGPVGRVLTMSGHPRLNLVNSIAVLVLSLGLDLVLIPRYGLLGAALAGAFGVTLVNLLRLVEVYVVLRIHPYNLKYLKPAAAGLLAALPLVGLHALLSGLPLVARVAVPAVAALLVYGGVVILGLDEDDRVVLRALGRRLGRFLPRNGEAGAGA